MNMCKNLIHQFKSIAINETNENHIKYDTIYENQKTKQQKSKQSH